jgi:hypothetical protein
MYLQTAMGQCAPPLFYTKFQKVDAQKVSQNFWIALEPPLYGIFKDKFRRHTNEGARLDANNCWSPRSATLVSRMSRRCTSGRQRQNGAALHDHTAPINDHTAAINDPTMNDPAQGGSVKCSVHTVQLPIELARLPNDRVV